MNHLLLNHDAALSDEALAGALGTRFDILQNLRARLEAEGGTCELRWWGPVWGWTAVIHGDDDWSWCSVSLISDPLKIGFSIVPEMLDFMCKREVLSAGARQWCERAERNHSPFSSFLSEDLRSPADVDIAVELARTKVRLRSEFPISKRLLEVRKRHQATQTPAQDSGARKVDLKAALVGLSRALGIKVAPDLENDSSD